MAPSKDPPEEDSAERKVLGKKEKTRGRTGQESEAAPRASSSNTKTVKAKYEDQAKPVPDGVDEAEWYRAYNNANSQLHVKGTTKAAAARASGETRTRALALLAKRANVVKDNSIDASEETPSQTSHSQASLNNGNGETSFVIQEGKCSVLNDSNSNVTENNGDLKNSQSPTLQASLAYDTNKMSHKATTAGAQEKDSGTPEHKSKQSDTSSRKKTSLLTIEQLYAPAIAASLAESDTPTASMGPPYAVQTSSKTNKRRIVKQVSPEATSQSSPLSIADKVKGKSRSGKKSGEQEAPVNAKFQKPSGFFGRHDIEKPQPFGFEPSSVPDFDPKHPFKGKDSLPTPRQEFIELNSSFEKMRVEQKVACDEFIPDVPLEPSARSADDFNPDEKWESGPLKRFASFEPFARASPRSPISSRANSPTQKQAVKASKKKSNRGQKKKAAAMRKKAAAKEEKAKGKSTEPEEEEDEASPGASSNDGGSYCICGGPDDHRQMIACDACNIWFHCSCVGVKEGDIPLMDKYICVTCHVPDVLFTTWKPMCRLEGCRKPCNLERDPPSKYCSDEHKAKFWEDAVARAPDGPGPSRGGALTKGELKALLEKTKGNVKAFHALGKKPTLPTPVEAIDWNKILTDEEKGRLCQITADKQVLNLRSQGLKDKEKVVRMAMDRLKKAIEARKELLGVCGWDARLAMNEEEFQVWRNSQSGISVFESGVLDETFCEKRRCLRHGAWVKLTLTECRMEDNLVHKQLNKLRNEEHAMKDRANTRAASQL